jgi:hypothetical protein
LPDKPKRTPGKPRAERANNPSPRKPAIRRAPTKAAPTSKKAAKTKAEKFGVAAILVSLAAIAYVAIVLTVDTLATLNAVHPIHWAWFSWSVPALKHALDIIKIPRFSFEWLAWWPLARFDLFKFLLWFVVPFALCFRRMDWGALGFRGWKRIDLVLLLGIAAAGMLVMFVIPYVASLANVYHSMSKLTLADKEYQFVTLTGWNLSWIVGWEFMHRYFLLRHAQRLWPRLGWILIPISEGAYHLQKPPLEAFGMVVLSIILTQWVLRRKNVLLPFLAHFIIEFELLAFVLFFA